MPSPSEREIMELLKYLNMNSEKSQNGPFFILPYSSSETFKLQTVPVVLPNSLAIFNRKGEGVITVNSISYPISDNTLCLVPDGASVFISFEDGELEGALFIIDVHTFFPETSAHRALVGLKLLEHPCVSVTEEQMSRLMAIARVAMSYNDRTDFPFAIQALSNILALAYLEVSHIFSTNNVKPSLATSHSRAVTQKFLANVARDYRISREVAYYAKQLDITPKYLSLMVKESTGKGANEWIVDTVISNAKHILRTVDKTIQEISEIMGFPNSSFFVQYFKRYTGATPSKFMKDR